MEEWLRKFFAYLDAVQERWSEKWRLHTNRRSIFIMVLVGMTLTYAYIGIIQSPDDFPINKLVNVANGDSLTAISESLQREEVIRSGLVFRVIVMVLGTERTVRAGDYLFKEPKDIFSVARAMSKGAFGLEPMRIRIPEGATTKEMSIIFASRLERFNQANFLAQAQPSEGYFFPDTYFFMPNATEDSVIQAMRQNFDTRALEIEPLLAASGKSLSDIVTLASIIEREARDSDDRRMISGVLWNRLERNMPLQVDVTFLYTIGKGTFDLTIKDLTTDSPYNTYMNKGLPPTAIGSPSMDSLLAAVSPTENDYLYYLADNYGVTHFSKTYAEHLRKKRLYLGT